MASFIDTHCHLNDPNLSIPVDEAITNATAVGVTQFVVPGVDLETSRRAVGIAAKYPGVCFAAVGIHPHEVVSATFDLEHALEELRKLVRPSTDNSQLPTHNSQTNQNYELPTTNYQLPATAVAVGEIGIDYHHHDREETGQQQREAFAAQLELAIDLDLPAIVHGRDAYDDVLDVIRAYPGSRGVLHSFEAPYEVAKTALDLGWLLGFTALVTYEHSDILANVIQSIPLDAFMLETDSPYLPPQSMRHQALGIRQHNKPTVGGKVVGSRGRNNQPAYLVETARVIADLRSITLDELGEATTRTARQFFNVPTQR